MTRTVTVALLMFIMCGQVQANSINLPAALAYILEDEGPELNLGGSEPGGGSKYGVSMVNLIDWNKAHGLPVPTIDDLAKMTPEFAGQIYTETFAKPLRFNDLPSGVDYQLLNIAVNLGVTGGVMALQVALKVWPATGKMDDNLIALAKAADPKALVQVLGAVWLSKKHENINWNPSAITSRGYGHGWTNRAIKADARALAMID